MFDSIIGTAAEKFGLSSDQSGGLLAALLGLVKTGGFTGFLDRFRTAGLSDTVNSWITTGNNTLLSGEQLESALGEDTIASLANQSGVDRATATAALTSMIPSVVDTLTPAGEVADESTLLSTIGGFLSNWGGALGGAAIGGMGAAGAFAGGAADQVSGAAGATFDEGKEVYGDGTGAVGGAAGTVSDRVSGITGNAGNTFDGDGDNDENSVLKWLLPLIILGLLIALGFWFCSKAPTSTTPVGNANANKSNAAVVVNSNSSAKAIDSSFKLVAKDGKYTASGVVPDQAALDKIKAALTAQFGEGNVDFTGLRVDAAAKPFAAGWSDNFSKILPDLKGWTNGTIAFAGNAITEAGGLPAAAITQIKSLFATGWTLPVSIAGEATATKQANEEALKELGEADSADEVVKALNLSIINFASGKSDIPADAQPILAKAAEVLKKQPAGTNVEIGGYTDNQGNSAANKTLSQARADAVKKALAGLGVSDAMLKSVGYGDAAPVGDNTTADGRFKNRRIEYKTGTGGAPTATTTTNSNSATANANSNR